MIRIACLAALVSTLAPAYAYACGNQEEVCDWEEPIPDFVELQSTFVPEDGALLLVVAEGADTSAWSLEVAVYDELGIEVEGTLDSDWTFATTTWRPAAPWQAGERYFAVLEIVTDPEGGLYPECNGFALETIIDIVEAVGDTTPPPVTIEESWSLVPHEQLDTLVCCDGASPAWHQLSDPSYGCSDPGEEIGWGHGACVVSEGHGVLDVSYRLSLANQNDQPRWALRVLTEQKTLRDASRNLLIHDRRTAAGCVRIEILDRVLGVVHDQTACHGEELADELGPLPLEIAAELAERCTADPYVCEVSNDGWDMQRCRAWPVQADAPYLDEPVPPDPPEVIPGATPPLADSGCRLGEPRDRAFALLLLVGAALLRSRRAR